MSAFPDHQLVTVVHYRAAIVVICCYSSQRDIDIQLCYGPGCTLNPIQFPADAFQQIGKKAVLQSNQTLMSAQNLILQLF